MEKKKSQSKKGGKKEGSEGSKREAVQGNVVLLQQPESELAENLPVHSAVEFSFPLPDCSLAHNRGGCSGKGIVFFQEEKGPFVHNNHRRYIACDRPQWSHKMPKKKRKTQIFPRQRFPKAVNAKSDKPPCCLCQEQCAIVLGDGSTKVFNPSRVRHLP